MTSFMLSSHQTLFGDQIKDKMGGKPVACVWERRGAYRAFGGKRDRKGPLGRPRHRLEENIKMYLKEVGWREGGMD
jgi:hypothetical protein